MRRAVAGALCAIIASCGGCSRPATPGVSYVDVPTTMAELLAKQATPDVVVTVKRVSRSQGGPGCAHSAVCLIVVVPMLLVNALFPDKYDVVTIEEKGVITYTGTFSTSGTFLHAQVRTGTLLRDIRRLELAVIDRSPIVEVGRGEVSSDGGIDHSVKTPILPQLAPVDLLAEYRTKLLTKDHVSVVTEAWAWLGPEATPIVRERFEDPTEGDAEKAAVLGTVCAAQESPDRAALLSLAAAAQEPLTALAGAKCTLAADPALATRFINTLTNGACTAKEPAPFLDGLRQLADENREQLGKLVAGLQKCDQPTRRFLVREASMLAITAVDLAAAANSKDSASELVFTYLTPGVEGRREALLAVIREHSVPYLEPIRSLAAAGDSMGPADVSTIAASYLVDEDAKRDPARRALTLDVLSRRPTQMVASAQGTLSAALSRAPESAKPRIALALVVLGKTEFGMKAARGLHGFDPEELWDAEKVTSDQALLSYGLRLSAGCRREQLKSLASLAISPEAVGAVCTNEESEAADAGAHDGGLAGLPTPNVHRRHHHHH